MNGIRDSHVRKFAKSGTLAESTVHFSLCMRFLLPAFLIIVSLFYLDLDVISIHRDLCPRESGGFLACPQSRGVL
jgi:hypothetical protein